MTRTPQAFFRRELCFGCHIVVDISELVVEDISDAVEFLIIVDGNKDLLIGILLALLYAKNDVLIGIGIILCVGDEGAVLLAAVLKSSDKLEFVFVAVFVCKSINENLFFSLENFVISQWCFLLCLNNLLIFYTRSVILSSII